MPVNDAMSGVDESPFRRIETISSEITRQLQENLYGGVTAANVPCRNILLDDLASQQKKSRLPSLRHRVSGPVFVDARHPFGTDA